jgi:hypothetical protein
MLRQIGRISPKLYSGILAVKNIHSVACKCSAFRFEPPASQASEDQRTYQTLRTLWYARPVASVSRRPTQSCCSSRNLTTVAQFHIHPLGLP